MKKWILLMILVFAKGQTVSAIDITVKPYLGGGLGIARQGAGSDYVGTCIQYICKDTKNKTILYSAGEGLKVGLGIDVGLSDNLSIEPVIGYSKGLEKVVDKTDYRYYYKSPYYPYPVYENSYISSTKKSTSFFPFSMTIKVRAKKGAFTPYAGIGPTLVLLAKSIGKYEKKDRLNGEIVKREEETTHKMGLGLHGVAGTNYNLSENLAFFFQVRADQLSLKPSKGKVTKYTVNGVDKLPTLDVSERETIYKDDTGGYVYNANQPSVENAYPLAASSVAIQIGGCYKFDFGGRR